MNELIIFLIAFVAPMLYWRTLFYVASQKFDKPFTREKTGLQVHHGHFGILFILLADIALIFNARNIFVIALLGLAWDSCLMNIFRRSSCPATGRSSSRPIENHFQKRFICS